jgi:polar amino acid transport system substrate-binding protein
MKRLISLFAVTALCLALLAGCTGSTGGTSGTDNGGTSGADNGDTAAFTTIKEGVLTVGMEIGYPPMEYLDADGITPIGFDVEVAYALGAKLGLEVKLEDVAWDAIFTSLDSNRYDVIISSVSINDERDAKYNLTRPYIANRLVLITAQDSAVTSPDDLAGLRVATQTETTADELMRSLMADGLAVADNAYFVYDKIIQAFDELKLGRVDAVMVDSVVAAYYLGADAASYKTAWESDEGEPMGLCLKKGNDGLTAAIEDGLDALYADGTVAEIATKYFGRNVTDGVR